jgi:hypothetical protein
VPISFVAAQSSTNVFSTLLPPWPGAQHPQASAYRRTAAKTLIEIGLIRGAPGERATRRFDSTVLLDTQVYPHALDLERLLAVGMFSQWLFFLDDEYDDHPTIGRDPGAVRKLMTLVFDVLDSGILPVRPTPFLHFTASVRRRLDELAPPGWTVRFLGHVKDYLFRGSLRAVEYWALDRVPSLDEYLRIRMLDSAVFPALDMSEIAGGLRLPDAVRKHPLLVEMKELAVRYIACINDIFSYQKEVLLAGTSFNLVHVLMHENASNFEEAVQAAAGIVGDALARFLALEQSLPVWDASVAPHVRAHIAGMKAWMRGSFDFSLTSARYNAPDSPFAELRRDRHSSIFRPFPEGSALESSRNRLRSAARRTITFTEGSTLAATATPPSQRWSRGQSLDDAPLSKRGAPASARAPLERHSQPPTQ